MWTSKNNLWYVAIPFGHQMNSSALQMTNLKLFQNLHFCAISIVETSLQRGSVTLIRLNADYKFLEQQQSVLISYGKKKINKCQQFRGKQVKKVKKLLIK